MLFPRIEMLVKNPRIWEPVSHREIYNKPLPFYYAEASVQEQLLLTQTAMATSTSTEYVLYSYTPSLPLAILAIIAFAILTFAHLIRLVRTRAKFCIPLFAGGLCG